MIDLPNIKWLCFRQSIWTGNGEPSTVLLWPKFVSLMCTICKCDIWVQITSITRNKDEIDRNQWQKGEKLSGLFLILAFDQVEIVSNVNHLLSCFLIEIPTECMKSKLLIEVLAPFKCDAPILPCSDLDNDIVRYSSVVRWHYIFLLEPSDVRALYIRKTADLPLQLLVGTFPRFVLLDFINYQKPLYKSLHQSFFYSFITILPSESGVTLHYSTILP